MIPSRYYCFIYILFKIVYRIHSQLFGSPAKTAVLSFMAVNQWQFHMGNMYWHDTDRCRTMCRHLLGSLIPAHVRLHMYARPAAALCGPGPVLTGPDMIP